MAIGFFKSLFVEVKVALPLFIRLGGHGLICNRKPDQISSQIQTTFLQDPSCGGTLFDH
ncbi:hypothetical protein CCACVL1_20509 [Corchorus capsularis]|uniref:Uncharacterized protein n=1 Tax=Corchorus capsularis TaxID=210143 RepID=A0A1R3HAW2_COCAP|nr:hypothetical protein CCACVL1_20509 [Corchorus capsularis]